MNGIFFYIGLGAGLAAACGVRPFLPLLLAGGLASDRDLGVSFQHGHFHFLQDAWWLVAVAVVMVLAYAVQLLAHMTPTLEPAAGRGRAQPLAAALAGLSYGSGGLLFAATLAAHSDAWWPGLVGGIAAAATASLAVAPIIAGARRRLPDRAAREALSVYLDALALALALVVALLHPLGYVVVALFAWLLLRSRSRAGERYAGLRILGR